METLNGKMDGHEYRTETLSAAELGLTKARSASLLPDAPLRLSVLGDPALLSGDKLGLFCSAELAQERDKFVAAVADRVCFIYTTPGGTLESIANDVREAGKPIIALP